jgi:hypothetical protein
MQYDNFIFLILLKQQESSLKTDETKMLRQINLFAELYKVIQQMKWNM